MADVLGREVGEGFLDAIGVGDVELCELRLLRDVVARPGREVVDDEHLVASLDEGVGHVRADEPGSAGHDDSHVSRFPFGTSGWQLGQYHVPRPAARVFPIWSPHR